MQARIFFSLAIFCKSIELNFSEEMSREWPFTICLYVTYIERKASSAEYEILSLITRANFLSALYKYKTNLTRYLQCQYK